MKYRKFLPQLRKPVILFSLVALVLVASAGISSFAAKTTKDYLNANWRGTYDILVTPRSERNNFVINNLVEPNYLGTAANSRISEQQLEAVRKIPNVQVAAPVGWIGNYLSSSPTVEIDVSWQKEFAVGHLHRQKIQIKRVNSNTGKTELLYGDTTYSYFYPPLSEGLIAVQQGYEAYGYGYYIWGYPLPRMFSPFIAVDPAAESQLLGDEAKFLRPLLPYQNISELPIDRMKISESPVSPKYPVLTAEEFPLEDSKLIVSVVDEVSTTPLPDQDVAYLSELIKNNDHSVGKKLREKLALAVQSNPEFKPFYQGDKDVTSAFSMLSLAKGNTQEHDGSKTNTADLNPFLHVQMAFDGRSGVFSLSRPDYKIIKICPNDSSKSGGNNQNIQNLKNFKTCEGKNGQLAVEVKSLGLAQEVNADLDFKHNDLQLAWAQKYRVSKAAEVANREAITHPYSVGSYKIADLPADKGQATYSPLGAYKNPVVREASGAALPPAMHGLDFFNLPPGQITSMSVAKILLGYQPIDAIRIRLAKLPSTYQEGIIEVEKVIRKIRELGMDAYAIAGSSPAKQTLVLEGRLVEGRQVVGDVGPVTQEWNYLAASSALFAAVKFGQTYLGAFSFFMVLAGLMILLFLIGKERRTEVEVLRLIGHSERAITNCLGKVPLQGTLLITIAALISVLLEPSLARLVVGIATIGAGLLGGALYVYSAKHFSRGERRSLDNQTGRWRNSRRQKRQRRRGRFFTTRPLRGAVSLVMRRIRRAPGPVLMTVCGYLTLAVGSALLVATLVRLNLLGGDTRLRAQLNWVVIGAILLLALVSLVMALWLAGFGSRQLARLREQEMQVYNTIGISSGLLRKAQILEGCLVTLSALLAIGATILGIERLVRLDELQPYRLWLVVLVPVVAWISHFLAGFLGEKLAPGRS